MGRRPSACKRRAFLYRLDGPPAESSDSGWRRRVLHLQRRWRDQPRRGAIELERAQQQFQRVSDNEKVSKEVVAQLRQQYDQKLHESIRQKTELATQLESASALLEAERARLSKAQRSSGGGQDSEAIAAEVSRVEQQLSQSIAVVDNPDTELSTVIRKNVEKAELDAYLKGILFCLGRR